MRSFWPLSALVDYITTVPFGPCSPGSRVRLISGGSGHYDNEFVYVFKRIEPAPEISFEERHPGEFQPDKYFMDFLTPASPLPSQSPWPFGEGPESQVYSDEEILFKKAPVLLVEHDEQGNWSFLSKKKSAGNIVVRFGDVVSLDLSLERIKNLPRGWTAQRDSMRSSWSTVKS